MQTRRGINMADIKAAFVDRSALDRGAVATTDAGPRSESDPEGEADGAVTDPEDDMGEPGEPSYEEDFGAVRAYGNRARERELTEELTRTAATPEELVQELNDLALAREFWDVDTPLGLKFYDLPVKAQAEYVRAVVRNNTFDAEGRPELSTSDLIRLQDEIAERVKRGSEASVRAFEALAVPTIVIKGLASQGAKSFFRGVAHG